MLHTVFVIIFVQQLYQHSQVLPGSAMYVTGINKIQDTLY